MNRLTEILLGSKSNSPPKKPRKHPKFKRRQEVVQQGQAAACTTFIYS